jgi:anaerobic ribonucleoside-triphosphate reductase activating protein
MGLLNIHRYLDCTETEGPGKRFCIWTQGCLRECSGCCNPDMQEIKPMTITSVDSVIQEIAESKERYDIEGITVLGGEPMIQAIGLAELAEHLQMLGLSVIIFTGYTFSELQNSELRGVKELLKYIDVLIDGPFEANKPDYERNWVGSTNQEFHYLTSRYKPEIEDSSDYHNSIELRIGHQTMQGNGCPFTLSDVLSKI